METYLYMLLGLLSVLILLMLLTFVCIMLFKDESVLKHGHFHKHKFLQ
ncbi:MAG: hypothetical protein Q8933_11000 [Bacteroidota bacterium]|nr:hypothetical protein [Bacteroidota bacterium]MDP4193115.1 hypothetical protein [Bacteroidota bacterium]MDP4195977.1 hypothetical protein [Bacteroidota bacterium]